MTTRTRGRPRSYDPELVLERALHAFWRGGFSGTSVDALAQATGLNRPSLYLGLGDKRTIYIKAMRRFQGLARARFGAALAPRADDRSFADVIVRYLHAAIEVDGPQAESGLSGCAVVSTASAEALSCPQIRQVLEEVVEQMDSQLLHGLHAARERGMLAADADIPALQFLLASAAHGIGIRARAGTSRQALEQVVDAVARTLCPMRP